MHVADRSSTDNDRAGLVAARDEAPRAGELLRRVIDSVLDLWVLLVGVHEASGVIVGARPALDPVPLRAEGGNYRGVWRP